MRVSIVAVAACVAFASLAASPVSAQAADVWQVTQGVCGDWKGTWVMEHVGPGHWMGKSVIRVESNQCSHSPIGTQLVSNVDFTTRVDRTWTATGTDAGTGRQCRYSGAVTSGNSAAGAYVCGGSSQQANITITSAYKFYNE